MWPPVQFIFGKAAVTKLYLLAGLLLISLFSALFRNAQASSFDARLFFEPPFPQPQ